MNYILGQGRSLIALGLLLLAACGTTAPRQGDPTVGQQLFSGKLVIAGGNAPACATCHTAIVGEQPSMGLNMSNIGNRAATRVPSQTAQEYIRTSILSPDSYLAGGFQEGIMYRDYGKDLSAQQVDDLVAYMLTLRSGQD